MQKLKEYKYLILIVLFILGFAFYWFGWRPYKAKKDCAWVKMHTDAIPYKPAQGSQTAVNNCQNQCKTQSFSNGFACYLDCQSLYSPEQKAEPAQDWWQRTTYKDYSSCLIGKGF